MVRGKTIGFIAGIGAAAAALGAAAVLRRTSSNGHVPGVVAAPRLSLDIDAIAERLGQAARIATVSREEPREEESAAFPVFRDYLEKTYPGLHGTLSRELVAGGTLLYTWPGSDPCERVGRHAQTSRTPRSRQAHRSQRSRSPHRRRRSAIRQRSCGRCRSARRARARVPCGSCGLRGDLEQEIASLAPFLARVSNLERFFRGSFAFGASIGGDASATTLAVHERHAA